MAEAVRCSIALALLLCYLACVSGVHVGDRGENWCKPSASDLNVYKDTTGASLFCKTCEFLREKLASGALPKTASDGPLKKVCRSFLNGPGILETAIGTMSNTKNHVQGKY